MPVLRPTLGVSGLDHHLSGLRLSVAEGNTRTFSESEHLALHASFNVLRAWIVPEDSSNSGSDSDAIT
jgi:hypothetical protein